MEENKYIEDVHYSEVQQNQFDVLPIKNTVLFPGVLLPIAVSKKSSLKLMKAAVSKHEINPLNAIPVSYSIKGSLLKSLFNSWNSMVGGNGQKFATLTDAQYKELRSYHLHYSGNDSFSVNGAVNSVEHEQISANEALITRRIFYGKNQKEKSYFLSHLN